MSLLIFGTSLFSPKQTAEKKGRGGAGKRKIKKKKRAEKNSVPRGEDKGQDKSEEHVLRVE